MNFHAFCFDCCFEFSSWQVNWPLCEKSEGCPSKVASVRADSLIKIEHYAIQCYCSHTAVSRLWPASRLNILIPNCTFCSKAKSLRNFWQTVMEFVDWPFLYRPQDKLKNVYLHDQFITQSFQGVTSTVHLCFSICQRVETWFGNKIHKVRCFKTWTNHVKTICMASQVTWEHTENMLFCGFSASNL